MRIVRLDRTGDHEAVEAALEAIMFANAARSTLADAGERDAFVHRWLGRYLYRHAGDCFLARDTGGVVVGYIAGCIVNAAEIPAFGDVGYFGAFARTCRSFPAHFHINVAPSAQRQGVGGRLVEAFIAHCRRERVPGVHAVTAAAAGNVAFYQRLGFAEVDRRTVSGRCLVMLGRGLASGR